ncbi:MAG TPA: 3-isopropylmalate dehydratase small subunit [Bacteroidales bacterium]|nr:3-isopropylmalate dehydratase small subunit [Bacteroidales bacterium]
MAKVKFDILETSCVPIPLENVDTDQIIPARFLSATARAGFGDNLFRDWRYNKKGEPEKNFILNNPVYDGKVLVAGKNFGSGSSREHAVWAIFDYGFRAVVSSFFADIFMNNALNNGLLPIIVPEEFLRKLFDMSLADPSSRVKIDLEKQTLTIQKTGESVRFNINPYKKECLLKGLDDVDFLVSMRSEILSYETNKSNTQ